MSCRCYAYGVQGASSSYALQNSTWEHLRSCGLAQYDTGTDSPYPFMETAFRRVPPELEDAQIQKETAGQLSFFSPSDRQRIEKLIEFIQAIAKENEEKRSHALRNLPLASFRDIKHLDFYKMGFTPDEIVERVNALAAPTFINLKSCGIRDDDFAKMKLPKTLKKLILCSNPLSEKALKVIQAGELNNLEFLCLAHTSIPREAVTQLATEKLRVFV